MKQCSSCGLNSSEIALYCQTCGTVFAAVAADASAPPVPIPEPPPAVTQSHLTPERKLVVFELCLVCFIAFGGSLLASTYHWFSGLPNNESVQPYRWWYGMSHEVGALALLCYVLQRHGQNFAHLGLRWNWLDAALTPVLWAACMAAYYVCRFFLWTYFSPLLDSRMDKRVTAYLFSGGVTVATILFGILNPFFEELIVRAYLMTQLRKLGCNVVVAAAASVLVQISYHFYQGTWAALSHMGEFFILSVYYAKTNRILAPILVHLISDLWPTFYYLLHPVH